MFHPLTFSEVTHWYLGTILSQSWCACLYRHLWKNFARPCDMIKDWLSFFWKVFYTAQKMKFSIKDFFSKCDQIHKKLRIWSHLLKKSLMENCTLFLKSFLFVNSSIASHFIVPEWFISNKLLNSLYSAA